MVFEGVIGFITAEGEEAFNRYSDAGNWLSAAKCWSLNDLAIAKLTDLCVRLSVNVEVATFAGPQEFADALEFILCDQELVPIRRVIASTPERTARRATFATDIISVYDPEPGRSMSYGGKGRHLTSIHQLGILQRHGYQIEEGWNPVEITKEPAELALFKTAVKEWSKQFSPSKLQRFAYVMGSPADTVTHQHFYSFAQVGRLFRKFYKTDISYSTVVRRLHLFEEAGILTIERRRQGEFAEHPGRPMSNLYTLHFNKVLNKGEIKDHDFYGAIGVSFDTQLLEPSLTVD